MALVDAAESVMPTDFSIAISDVEALKKLPFFKLAEKADGSYNSVPEGYFSCEGKDELIITAFDLPSGSFIIGSIRLGLQIVKMKEKDPLNHDQNNELYEILNTSFSSSEKEYKKLLRNRIAISTKNDPFWLVCTGVLDHLEGRIRGSRHKFRRFGWQYEADEQTGALINIRKAKCFSANGNFDYAYEIHKKLIDSNYIPDIERARAIRESCNAITQIAWERPNALYWSHLQTRVEQLKDLLGDIKDSADTEFLNASCDEFSAIAKMSGKPNRIQLSEIERSIDRQLETNETTAKNRYTQLAALYLRVEDPGAARELADRYAGEKRAPLELALNNLVSALASRDLGKRSEAATKIESAIQYLNQTATDRFRRPALAYQREFTGHADSQETKYLRGFWPIDGGSKFISAFVPEDPPNLW